jgi:hypothetical protein
MDQDEKWAVIAEQRRVLADVLAGLPDHQWEQPSLCSQWRVRDLAAPVLQTPESAVNHV